MLALELGTVGCHSASNSGTPRPFRWSGILKPNRLNSELGRSVPNNGYGSVTVTPIPEPPPRVRIEISISAPVTPGEHVAWALLSGTCGSAHPMLAGKSEFPTIEIGENETGSVRVEMPLTLEANGSYHADVYWPNSSRDLNDVMMCANLSFGS